MIKDAKKTITIITMKNRWMIELCFNDILLFVFIKNSLKQQVKRLNKDLIRSKSEQSLKSLINLTIRNSCEKKLNLEFCYKLKLQTIKQNDFFFEMFLLALL